MGYNDTTIPTRLWGHGNAVAGDHCWQRNGHAGVRLGTRPDRRGRIISAVVQTDPDRLLWGRIGRRSIRLAGHDYRQRGAYFVTICAKARAPLLGEIRSGIGRFNAAGLTAPELWLAVPRQFPHARMDEVVIMPN